MQLAQTDTMSLGPFTARNDRSHPTDRHRKDKVALLFEKFLSDAVTRSLEIAQRESERRSSDAERAFVNIMARWKITADDARQLLGEMSKDPYTDLETGSVRVLDKDKIRRIAHLVGIFKALNALYSEKLADRWMQLPNKNSIFGGMTPHDYLMQGGVPEFVTVHSLLDARRRGY